MINDAETANIFGVSIKLNSISNNNIPNDI